MTEQQDVAVEGLSGIFEDPLGVVRRRWPIMLPVLLVGLVGTGIFAWLQKPTYVAQASVLVASQRVPEDFVRPTIEEDPIETMNALTAEAFSQRNLGDLIEKHGLYQDLRQDLPVTAVIEVMRALIQIEVQEGVAPAPGRGDRAKVLLIRFEADTPTAAAGVANDLASLFADAGIRLRARQAKLTTGFLQRELDSTDGALREERRKISEFQQKYRGELPSELETNLRRLERLQDQRNSLAMQIAEADTRIATLAAEDIESAPETRLDELRVQLAREAGVNTETHPNVIALRRQIAAVEQDLRQNPGGARGGVVGAARREAEQLRAQLAQTDAQITALDGQVGRTPARAEELAAFEQRAKVLEETYYEYLRKVKEAELAESLETAQGGARVSVLDQAQPPLAPAKGRAKWLIAGALASLGAAAALGLLLELRDPVLVSARGVETASGLPVLGTMPRVD
jgi:uncharacterized protein involved in exopolysaccharide biosynthesis